MSNIERSMKIVLEFLYDHPRELVEAVEIQEATRLDSQQINDACSILKDYGYLDLMVTTSLRKFDFNCAQITSMGRLEYEKINKQIEQNKLTQNHKTKRFHSNKVKNILRHAITIITQLLVLILASFWYLTTKDYEPIIVGIISFSALSISLVSRLKSKEEKRIDSNASL